MGNYIEFGLQLGIENMDEIYFKNGVELNDVMYYLMNKYSKETKVKKSFLLMKVFFVI